MVERRLDPRRNGLTTHMDVTGLLIDWANGDAAALETLLPIVYKELRRIARREMRRESADHTLQRELERLMLHEIIRFNRKRFPDCRLRTRLQRLQLPPSSIRSVSNSGCSGAARPSKRRGPRSRLSGRSPLRISD